MDEQERPYHDVAGLFPLMQGEEFEQLKADIAANGLREPIYLHPDGSIIDGRNRHRACIETDTPPRFRTWKGDGSLVAFVVSLNLHRRHLTGSQRAAIARRVLPMLEDETPHGGDRRSDDFQAGKISHLKGRPRDHAGKMFGVSGRYVGEAERIAEEAPDLIEQVEAGAISIPKAKREIAKRNGAPHVAHNSGNNEWYTPAEFVDAARAVMGSIDLDPASSDTANEEIEADHYYTAETDGLAHDWRGRVWMNPPYAGELIGQFTEKLVEHFVAGDVSEAIVLVNNATETGWFQGMIEYASAVCFPRGRVKFWKPDGEVGAPLQGQAVIYLGVNRAKFLDEFEEIGWGAVVNG